MPVTNTMLMQYKIGFPGPGMTVINTVLMQFKVGFQGPGMPVISTVLVQYKVSFPDLEIPVINTMSMKYKVGFPGPEISAINTVLMQYKVGFPGPGISVINHVNAVLKQYKVGFPGPGMPIINTIGFPGSGTTVIANAMLYIITKINVIIMKKKNKLKRNLTKAFLFQGYALSRLLLLLKVLPLCLSWMSHLASANDAIPLVRQLSLQQSIQRLGGRPLGLIPLVEPNNVIRGDLLLYILMTWP